MTINGRPVTCEKDSMLLEVALANGFDIPALCYHEAEPPYGACRLCLVEITRGGRSSVEASCTYPVRQDGIEVKTDSEKVRRYRRLNMELLLARCPESEAVRQMARKLGVERTRLPQDGTDQCILCGRCIRISAGEELGLALQGRGFGVRVGVPFGESLAAGLRDTALACAAACPTGAIVARRREE